MLAVRVFSHIQQCQTRINDKTRPCTIFWSFSFAADMRGQTNEMVVWWRRGDIIHGCQDFYICLADGSLNINTGPALPPPVYHVTGQGHWHTSTKGHPSFHPSTQVKGSFPCIIINQNNTCIEYRGSLGCSLLEWGLDAVCRLAVNTLAQGGYGPVGLYSNASHTYPHTCYIHTHTHMHTGLEWPGCWCLHRLSLWQIHVSVVSADSHVIMPAT